jgi:hypothetical protein
MLIVDLYILEFVPSSTFNLAELNLHTSSKLSNPSCKIQGHTCQTKILIENRNARSHADPTVAREERVGGTQAHTGGMLRLDWRCGVLGWFNLRSP